MWIVSPLPVPLHHSLEALSGVRWSWPRTPFVLGWVDHVDGNRPTSITSDDANLSLGFSRTERGGGSEGQHGTGWIGPRGSAPPTNGDGPRPGPIDRV